MIAIGMTCMVVGLILSPLSGPAPHHVFKVGLLLVVVGVVRAVVAP